MAEPLAALVTNDPELSAVFAKEWDAPQEHGRNLFIHHALQVICKDCDLHEADEQVRGVAAGMWDGLPESEREFWSGRAHVARSVKNGDEFLLGEAFLLLDGSTALSRDHGQKVDAAFDQYKRDLMGTSRSDDEGLSDVAKVMTSDLRALESAATESEYRRHHDDGPKHLELQRKEPNESIANADQSARRLSSSGDCADETQFDLDNRQSTPPLLDVIQEDDQRREAEGDLFEDSDSSNNTLPPAIPDASEFDWSGSTDGEKETDSSTTSVSIADIDLTHKNLLSNKEDAGLIFTEILSDDEAGDAFERSIESSTNDVSLALPSPADGRSKPAEVSAVTRPVLVAAPPSSGLAEEREKEADQEAGEVSLSKSKTQASHPDLHDEGLAQSKSDVASHAQKEPAKPVDAGRLQVSNPGPGVASDQGVGKGMKGADSHPASISAVKTMPAIAKPIDAQSIFAEPSLAIRVQSPRPTSPLRRSETGTSEPGTDDGKQLFLHHALSVICEDMEIYQADEYVQQVGLLMWEELSRSSKRAWIDDALRLKAASKLKGARSYQRPGGAEKDQEYRIQIIKALAERNDGELKYLQDEFDKILLIEKRLQRHKQQPMRGNLNKTRGRGATPATSVSRPAVRDKVQNEISQESPFLVSPAVSGSSNAYNGWQTASPGNQKPVSSAESWWLPGAISNTTAATAKAAPVKPVKSWAGYGDLSLAKTISQDVQGKGNTGRKGGSGK